MPGLCTRSSGRVTRCVHNCTVLIPRHGVPGRSVTLRKPLKNSRLVERQFFSDFHLAEVFSLGRPMSGLSPKKRARMPATTSNVAKKNTT